MKKHFILSVLVLFTLILGIFAAARAEIIPPYGEGQFGLQAVVLCEELTVRVKPGTSSGTVRILPYGSRINITEQSDGWARCVIGDSEDADSGWVSADYIIIDPAWYRTEGKTPVYAWDDTSAPKVALLDANELLPVLKQEGDWLIVSLRGATGWICVR